MQRDAPKSNAEHQAYSTAQVAALMGVARQTVSRWVDAGRIAAFDIGAPGRPRIRITQAALQAFIDGNDVEISA